MKFLGCECNSFAPLNGTSMTNGALMVPSNLSGKSIFGILSPFFTVKKQDELSFPESQVISPVSPISKLLNTN